MKHYSIDLDALMPKRRQDLQGKDPSAVDLTKQVNNLSSKLAQKEELLLEKDMIINEVEALSARLHEQVTKSREEGSALNAQINDLCKCIKTVNRQMMSKVSELSMNQAHAMRLRQEAEEKRSILALAEENLKNGLTPSDEIENSWIKSETVKIQRLQQEERKNREIKNVIGSLGIDVHDISVAPESGVNDTMFFVLPDGTRTTACPRPNAYIPESQKDSASGVRELPIPKPYGKFAPVKPSGLSVPMMRYTRKAQALGASE